jgi:hypothetical protein
MGNNNFSYFTYFIKWNSISKTSYISNISSTTINFANFNFFGGNPTPPKKSVGNPTSKFLGGGDD